MSTKIPILFEVLEQKGRGAAKKLSLSTGISSGNISDWKSGKSAPTLDNLKAIADYFDCSVDYLLGRTDNFTSHKSSVSVSANNVSSNSGAIGIGNTVTNSAALMDEQTEEMLNTYKKLSPLNKAKMLVYADELAKK